MNRNKTKLSERNSQRGGYAVILTLGFVVLCMFVGLALDVGRAFVQQADLERTIDSASMAAASQLGGGITTARAAACNIAVMNGLPCAQVTAVATNIPDARGNLVPGVRISAQGRTLTTFFRAAKVLGCGSLCDALNYSASAVGAPGGSVDIVLNLDDTGSMSGGGWLTPAKTGATALVNAMVPTTATTSSPTKVSLVPFRGCYKSTGTRDNGCEDTREYATGDLISLTTSNTNLRAGINALDGNGGSGSNNCEGLAEARLKLFQTGGYARPTAKKFMIVLTDANSSYDTGSPATFTQCRPSGTSGSNNQKVNLLAYNIAQDIKNGANVGTTGQIAGQTVEIFVILYGSSGPVPASCTPPPNGTTAWNTTALNLGRCIASNAANVYLAPTPAQITTVFQQIISRLPVRLVN